MDLGHRVPAEVGSDREGCRKRDAGCGVTCAEGSPLWNSLRVLTISVENDTGWCVCIDGE